MKKLFLIGLFFTPQLTNANPIEYDVGDTHVIVVRTIDAWTGDSSLSEATIDLLKEKTGAYNYYNNDGKLIMGATPLISFGTKDPLVETEKNYLELSGFKLQKLIKPATTIKIQKSLQIAPNEYPILLDSQKRMYEQLAINEGDPDSLEARVSSKKFFAGVLSIGALVLTANQYGVNAAQIVNNTNLPGDIYQFASKSKGAVAPLNIPPLDITQYKSIDVRRVIQGNNDRFGQIIIAYKADKTTEAENNALVKAIGSLMGVDTNVEEVKQSRQEDYLAKKAIWEAHKNDGKESK